MKSSHSQGYAIGLLPGRSVILVLFVVLAAVSPKLSSAQDGLRIGLTVGGVSKVGVVFERFLNGNQSLELTVGTWSFKEISTSLVIKRYFLSNDLDAGWYKPIHPFIGAGLWVVGAKPPAERLGLALSAIVPIGIDWSFPFDADPSCNNRSCPVGHHALGVSVNLNRALLVRRSNPEDQLPLNGRLVPLPGAYYRFMTRR
jgi:hypothetical protein|tara:strand:+ start:1260 stop:1859 length:600 start_codon:yes stop_codon:yes gene_type:complete